MLILKLLIKNPIGIYIIWIVLLLMFYISGVKLLHWSVDDGEEERNGFLGRIANIGYWGVIVIGLMSPVIHWDWYKKYRFYPVILPLGVSVYLGYRVIDIYLGRL